MTRNDTLRKIETVGDLRLAKQLQNELEEYRDGIARRRARAKLARFNAKGARKEAARLWSEVERLHGMGDEAPVRHDGTTYVALLTAQAESYERYAAEQEAKAKAEAC